MASYAIVPVAAVAATVVRSSGLRRILLVNVWLPVKVATVESMASVTDPEVPPPVSPVPAVPPVISPRLLRLYPRVFSI